MAEKFYVKTSPSGWNQITNFFVKTAANSWSTVSDAYVKVSSTLWQLFYSSPMSPSQQVEIEYFFYGTNTDSYRLQGTNYKWSPTPQSLKYYFRHVVDNTTTYYIGSGGSSGTVTSNPVTSTKLPGVSTYVNIDPAGSDYSVGSLNSYNFEVRATGASGTVYPSISTPFEFRSPKAPTLSFVVNTSTSVTLTITASSQNDYFATGRYILYTYDGTSGYVYSGGGRGGFSPTSSSMTKSLTGLVSGRNYTVYVLPITGTTGTTTSNYSGYPGVEAYLSGVATGSADPQAFSTISYVKNFPSSSSGGVVRTTSLSWNASTNATRYEIEYEGSYNNSSWTTVQSFAASAYTSSTSQSVSWGSPVPAGGFDYYTYMRARVRASNPDSATTVIGDNGSYIYASGVNPGQPTFGTITTTTTTASIPVTVGTAGSNFLYSPPIEYQYRESPFGSYSGTWVSSSTPISLTGLIANTTYYIKIRTRNYDELVSPENETNFQTQAALAKLATPTGVNATDNRTDGVNVTWNSVSGAAYYGVWYGSTPSYNSLADFGGNRNTSLITGTSYLDTAIGSGVSRDYYVQAYRSGDPAGTKSEWGGPDSGTRANIVVNYTVTWSANGGSVSPSSNVVTAGSSVTAPTPSRSGYTFDYWYDNSFSYIVYAGGSFTPPSSITMNASWTQIVVQTPAITSGPNISWGSGNNFTLSATASNATNLEFEVQYSSSQSGSPSTGSATYFFGASTGGGTTGSQASNRSWARTRVRANNSSTGLSSSFSSYTGWA